MIDLSDVPLLEYGHVQTTNNLPVRLLCKDRLYAQSPILGLFNHNGNEVWGSWNMHGVYGGEVRLYDLIPVPKKHVRWTRIFDCGLLSGILQTEADREKVDAEQEPDGPKYRWIRIEIDESKAEAA